MTIRRNPNQGNQEEKEAFIDQATTPETSRLHCNIPADLHMEFKMMAVRQGSNITTLVTAAMENYMAERR